jgi:hypothetical protein
LLKSWDGIRIEKHLTAGNREEVSSITYEPGTKKNHLRCPRAAAEPAVDDHFPPPRVFDVYSTIAFSDEKARLDHFAIYLQKDKPTFKGYVIYFSAKHARPGKAEARARRARDPTLVQNLVRSTDPA